jgi:DNA repair protein RadA/Sms
MAKEKKQFVCTNCGYISPKWQGQCQACNSWNTLEEEVVVKATKQEQKRSSWSDYQGNSGPQPVVLSEVVSGDTRRLTAPDNELNRVLGGGIVGGAIILLTGNPGIGKSTLMLQVALKMKGKVLYVSGEESEQQIKMRADRISERQEHCYILTETNTNKLLKYTKELQPDILVIDSIQVLSSPHNDSMPGSISQIRECAGELQRFAKESNTAVFIIGHVNKEGNVAGPKLLEHIVDTVLHFEGDRHYSYRILRTLKNRFGSTDEMGIYEMQANGLREVANPSELLLSQKDEDLSGSAVAATLEGMRPMLIETQALVSTSVYSTPQRSATGFDLRRLSMLLAVLEKRGSFPFAMNDVFLNIAGGIRVDDPAIDLAIVAALLSSLHDVAVPSNICFAGEVGLSGEIRTVNRLEQRIQEADRLGFQQIFISKYNTKGIDKKRYNIQITPISRIDELYTALFE